MTNLIPLSYTQEEHNLDLVSKEVHNRLSASLWTAPLLDPLRCDARFLPVLANFYSVDFWSDALSEADKRRLIASSIDMKRHKGSVWAVKKAIGALGLDVDVIEWFDENATPHTFRVLAHIPDSGYNMLSMHLVEDLVYQVKPVRSHLTSVGAMVSEKSDVFYGAVSVDCDRMTLFSNMQTLISMEHTVGYAGFVFDIETTIFEGEM